MIVCIPKSDKKGAVKDTYYEFFSLWLKQTELNIVDSILNHARNLSIQKKIKARGNSNLK